MMGMTKKERKIVEEFQEKFKAESRGRERLRERDTKRLLEMDTVAIGLAYKLLAATEVLNTDPIKSEMTDEAWAAYGLMVSLEYEDWGKEEIMAYGKEKG